MTRRRWIADSWDQNTAWLKGEQAGHLIRVLRAQTGMEFDIVAGDRVWRAAIAGIAGDTVLFNRISDVVADQALPVTLLLSIFKFDRMEWIIEKATELGAERFIPMIARRSEKHLGQTAQARVERWRRIAREASKQSRRSDVPIIENIVALKEAALAPAGNNRVRLLLAEQEKMRTLRAAIETANQDAASSAPGEGAERQTLEVAVGPEGGWTAEEEALFAAEGWKPVSLGPRILRAETAGIAAMAVIAALLE